MDCIPLKGPVADLARKMGGEVVRNKDGVVVVKGIGHDEAIFANEAEAFDHLNRTLEIAGISAEGFGRIKEAVLNGKDFDVDNVADMLKFVHQMSESHQILGGGEQPPIMARTGLNKGGEGSHMFTRQHGFLMANGEGGRYLANSVTRFDQAYEQGESSGMMRLQSLGQQLDRLTSVEEVNKGTAPSAVKDALNELWEPHRQMVEEMQDFLGIPENLVPPSGKLPTMVGISGDMLSNDLVEKAKTARIIAPNEGAEALAQRFNSVDFGGKPQTLTHREWRNATDWMKKQASSYMAEANHNRTSEQGMKSVEKTLLLWNRMVSRRLAEAAVWGPHLEHIEMAKELIAEGKPYARHIKIVDRVMEDLRGKVYIPRSAFERDFLAPMTKGMLASSGPRHLAQMVTPVMQHGVLPSIKDVGKALFDIQHFPGDVREFNRLGVYPRHAAFMIDEHPSDMFIERPAEDVKGLLGYMKQAGLAIPKGVEKFGTFGLHVFLNSGRHLSAVIARGEFDHVWEKALGGDRDKLALLADAFGFGDPTSEKGRAAFVDHLKNLDKAQAKDYFIKRMADLEGTTFHPKDFPGMARWPMGRWLTMFKSFKWNVVHNIWNQMTSPNYSVKHRAIVWGRFLAVSPLLASLDPIIRHFHPVSKLATIALAPLGIGQSNIDSRVAYQAMDHMLKDPKASSIAYALLQFEINGAALGIAGQMLQGWNLSDKEISKKVVVGDIPYFDDAANLWQASSLAADAVMSGDPHEQKKALASVLNNVPLGRAIGQAIGTTPKEPKVGRKQVIRKGLEKGAQAIGLQ